MPTRFRQWNPNLPGWEWQGGPDTQPAAYMPIDQEIGLGDEYSAALRQVFPNRYARPALESFLSQSQAPLRGLYRGLTAGQHGIGTGVSAEWPSFENWLMTRGTQPQSDYARATAQQATQIPSFQIPTEADIDWRGLGRFARAGSAFYPGGVEPTDLERAQWDPIVGAAAESEEIRDKGVSDLLALAMYPKVGGFLDRIDRGRKTMHLRDWADPGIRPGLEPIDILGYVLSQEAPEFMRPRGMSFA